MDNSPEARDYVVAEGQKKGHALCLVGGRQNSDRAGLLEQDKKSGIYSNFHKTSNRIRNVTLNNPYIALGLPLFYLRCVSISALCTSQGLSEHQVTQGHLEAVFKGHRERWLIYLCKREESLED